MTDVNTVTMTGNLTKDVEIRNNVAKFSIAVNRSTKDQNGNWIDVASYFDWVRFLSQNADPTALQQRLVKGTPVTVTGEARQNRWQDPQTGENRASIQFVVSNMKIGARQQPTPVNQAQQPVQRGYQAPAQPPVPPQPQQYAPQPAPQPQQPPLNYGQGPEAFDDSDIPF